MDCARGLKVIIIFKIQSRFQSGYFHSSSAVTEQNFGLQRQVTQKWSVELPNYEEGVVEQSRHPRVQKGFHFKACELSWHPLFPNGSSVFCPLRML